MDFVKWFINNRRIFIFTQIIFFDNPLVVRLTFTNGISPGLLISITSIL